MKNLFLRKMSWFYSGEKKRNISFNCLMFLGGRGRRIFLHRSVLFIARERYLAEVSHSGTPLKHLLSFISFSPLMDDESILRLTLSFFSFFHLFLFRHFRWSGDGGREELLIDMCHPICFFQVPVQQSHPSIPLTSSVSTLYSHFLWIFYRLVTKMSSPMVWNF